MVRKRRTTRRAPRSNANMRSNVRRLNRAVSEQATLIKPPADPPAISNYRTFTICTQAVILSDKTNTDYTAYVAPADHRVRLKFDSKDTHQELSISADDLLLTWLLSIGHKDSARANAFEVAVVKACLWGPLPQQLPASVSLWVSSGASQRVVTDHGSPTSRPRCGIGLPKLTWGESGQLVRIGFAPYIAGDIKPSTILGVLQLTIAGRMKGGF